MGGTRGAGSGRASIPQPHGGASEPGDQLCNPEPLFMVTDMASSLRCARNPLAVPPVSSSVWFRCSISLRKITIQTENINSPQAPSLLPSAAGGGESLSREQDKPLLEACRVQLECICPNSFRENYI